MTMYPNGARVRIRKGDWLRFSSYSEIMKYGDLSGEIVGSITIVAYHVRPWSDLTGPAQSVQAYKVRLDVGIEIDQVTEDCLELVSRW